MKIYNILPEALALSIGENVRKSEWPVGKARTKELTGTVKNNGEILSHDALQSIGTKIGANTQVQLDHIPLKLHPPKFSRYAKGDYYQSHTDAPWMGQTRTDLSCTLWLSNDYEGGFLRIEDKELKGAPGQCIVYNCGTPHEVTPVTSGERICAVTWIQSRIRDAHKRKLVSDFRKFLANFEDNRTLFMQGGQIHSALLRLWCE